MAEQGLEAVDNETQAFTNLIPPLGVRLHLDFISQPLVLGPQGSNENRHNAKHRIIK